MGSCKYTQELISDNSSNISAGNELTDSDGNTFISCQSTYSKAGGLGASSTVAAFKSYVPFIGPTYTSSMKGNSINADGSCCYMPQTNTELAYIEKDKKALFERTGKDFCAADFLLADISGTGIKTVGQYATYDYSSNSWESSTLFVCGKPSNNHLENFTGSVSTEVSNNIGGFKALIFIVIGVLLTTLAYAIFILTPFFYWTNAGNPKISNDENNCFGGVSLLDRFYPGDAKRYPYSENDS